MSNDFFSDEKGLICDECIATAKIGTFDPDELSSLGKVQWEQLGRRINLMERFDDAHPRLRRFKEWPIIGAWYKRRRFAYVMKIEP